MNSYDTMKVTELRAECKRRELKGYSRLIKAALIDLLEADDAKSALVAELLPERRCLADVPARELDDADATRLLLPLVEELPVVQNIPIRTEQGKKIAEAFAKKPKARPAVVRAEAVLRSIEADMLPPAPETAAEYEAFEQRLAAFCGISPSIGVAAALTRKEAPERRARRQARNKRKRRRRQLRQLYGVA